jgi:carbon-monoxide dehydrogenase small subunit
MSEPVDITLSVNGRDYPLRLEPRRTLLDAIREECGLTGTHVGCEHGVCGACTVLMDGAPARSCIAFAVACDGADVCTIEGLEDDPAIVQLRAAFMAEHALQCGYCTPGMLVTARDIVLRLPDADEARIRLELAGNLCRCTGYRPILHAARTLAQDYDASNDRTQKCGIDPGFPVQCKSELTRVNLEVLYNDEQRTRPLHFTGNGHEWYRPGSLAEVQRLKKTLVTQAGREQVKLVFGNTASGVLQGPRSVTCTARPENGE